jgi:N-acetylglucosaminyl-diphospho-decaprenol L-rhamnosyltransferase
LNLIEEIIAVIVVTYNSEALLPHLLASLIPGLAGVRWQLTVVDNASVDGSVDAVRRIAPYATIVQMGRNAGYAAGINAGVAASPPYTAVLVLNPDVRLGSGCVANLLPSLRTPGTGMAVPRLTDGSGTLNKSMRREPTILRTLGDAMLGATRAGRTETFGECVTDRRRYDHESVTDWAEGSTLLISGECWRRVGPWDESFFLYSEETDFALRMRDAGLVTRYTPNARAVHLGGESRQSPYLWTLLTLNRVRLYRRRHGLVATTGYWAVLVVRELSRAVLGRKPSQAALRALLSPRRFREVPGPRTWTGQPYVVAVGAGSATSAGSAGVAGTGGHAA